MEDLRGFGSLRFKKSRVLRSKSDREKEREVSGVERETLR